MKTIKLKKWSDKIPDNFTGCAECLDGSKHWYLNGKRHRKNDKPAVKYPDGEKYWLLNGKRHRINGPAIECPDGTKCWYLYDHYLTQEQHKHYVELINMEYEEDVIVWLMKKHGVVEE